MRYYFTLLLSLFLFYFSTAQAPETLNVKDSLAWSVNYDSLIGNAPIINPDYFYEANDLSLGYLLRARVPGMLTTRASGNPLDPYTIVSRGVSTFEGSTSPLIIVDGLPVFNLEGIDPMDVKSIEVEQDISGTSLYGLRGSNGILHIQTFLPSEKEPKVSYRTFASIDQAQPIIDILSAQEYVGFGGTNLGASTDWQDEIYRPAFSWAHHLAYQENFGNTRIAASGNYRSGKGVLINTDFNQSSVRLHLTHAAFRDKLKVQISAAGTYRDANPGFSEASAYAIRQNPTQAVLDPSLTDFGGYSQLSLFNYYNPVAILEQNTRVQNTNVQQVSGQLSFAFNDKLSMGTVVGAITRSSILQTYFPAESYYPILNRGQAFWLESDQSSTFIDAYLNYQIKKIDLRFGLRTQDFDLLDTYAEWQDIERRPFSFTEFTEGEGLRKSNENFNNFDQDQNDQRLQAFYISGERWISDYLHIKFNITREGSTRFGPNRKWGNFGGLNITAPIDKLFAVPNLPILFSAGFGVAGGVPSRSNLSKNIWENNTFGFFYQNGTYAPVLEYVQAPNDNLGPERTRSFNLGITFPARNWQASMHYFNRRSRDLIEAIRLNRNGGLAINDYVNQYINNGAVNSSGFEFNINAQMGKRDGRGVVWNTQFQTFAFTSDVEKRIVAIRYPLQASGAYSISVGEVGLIEALQTNSIANNTFVYEDLNRDGIICSGCREDTAPIGSGLPALNVSWQNNLSLGKWEIGCSFYGSFGHRVVSEPLLYSAFPEGISVYNRPSAVFDTDLRNVRFGVQFSNYFFELASFVRLEHLSFRYPLLQRKNLKLVGFIGFNNLFTIHGYSGANPEVRQNINQDPLLHGIDQQNNFPFSRSILFGFNIDLGKN